ncbi:hypothetical protein B0H10DRAFT_2093935, partial [Mycena sp. CBHHK59/15]
MHLTPEAARELELAEKVQAERESKISGPPPSGQEQTDAEMLVDITGTNMDQALRMLRKHKGDVSKAADAMLNGEDDSRTTEDEIARYKQTYAHLFQDGKSSGVDAPLPASCSNIIDLTGDDNVRTDTNFRVSNRSPDPSWQLVTTNQPMSTAKSHDDELNEVIQASYNDFASEELDTIPAEEVAVREGGRPIALRADMARKAYAALVVQCLFHVPQVRQRCSKLHLNHVDGNPPRSHPDYAIWNLLEMFTALDLGQISVFFDIDLLSSWEVVPLVSRSDSVGALSAAFLKKIVGVLQTDLIQQKVEENMANPLFMFSHVRVFSPVAGPPQTSTSDFGHVVLIETDPESASNELVMRLSETLNIYNEDGSSEHNLILQPSELVTFHIQVKPSSSTGASPEPFVYPKCIYMDQFMHENLDLANETRATQRQLQKDIEMLTVKKRNITRFEDQDTFENLRGAIHYYQELAVRNSEERLETLQIVAAKLKNTLQKLETESEAIDRQISSLQAELDGLFDTPELQCHPYDLRAVLVHTGLPGRKHIYSYVQDKGTWWKTVDYTVTEVPEELVMSDPAGLHLGAGPYMLMYSRRQTEEEMNAPATWPTLFADIVDSNNTRFMIGESQSAAQQVAGQTEDTAMDLS